MTQTQRAATFRWIPILIILVLFGSLLAPLILSMGVCCYDDASFAVIAKNLAEGNGYTFSLNYTGPEFSMRPFDPALGTGPSSIIPTAIVIKIFGATPWTPGFSQLALEIIILAISSAYLIRTCQTHKITLWLTAFLGLSILFSGKHNEQWTAMLGEVPAGLFIIAGVLAWSNTELRPRSLAASGLLFSLAVLTKEMVALYIVALIPFFLVRLFRSPETSSTKDKITAILFFSAAFTIPIILFEASRFFTLGPFGFVDNWQSHLAFIHKQSSSASGATAIFQQTIQRTMLFKEHFFISLMAVAILSTLALAATVLGRNESLKRATITLYSGMTIHFVYWLFLSNGSPRYIYTGVVILCCTIAMPLLGDVKWRYIPTLGIAVLIAMPGLAAQQASAHTILTTLESGPRLQGRADVETSTFIESNLPDQTLYTSWWAHVASIEYLSRHPGNFQGGFEKYLNMGSTPKNIIYNEALAQALNEQSLLQLHEKCGPPIFSSGPYRIIRCP